MEFWGIVSFFMVGSLGMKEIRFCRFVKEYEFDFEVSKKLILIIVENVLEKKERLVKMFFCKSLGKRCYYENFN